MRSNTLRNNRRAMAFICLLMLALMYKQQVLDPYFGQDFVAPPTQTAQNTSPATNQQQVTSQVANQAPSVSANSDFPTNQAPASSNAIPNDAQIEGAGYIYIETNAIRAEISKLGGRIKALYLKDYKQDLKEGGDLNVIEHLPNTAYPLGVYSGAQSDAGVRYSVSVSGATERDGTHFFTGLEQGDVILSGRLSDGRGIKKTISFKPDGFFFETTVVLSQAPSDASKIELEWTTVGGDVESSMFDRFNIPGFTWFDGSSASRKLINEFESDQANFGNVNWASYGDKYFMSALVTKAGQTVARGLKEGNLFKTRLSGGDVSGSYLVFVGPKSYQLLEEAGHRLELNVDFGWTGFVAAPLLFLLNMFNDLFGNYGVAIVALTLLVKLAFYPLNATSFKSMKAMQDIAPEVQKLRDTVKDKQQQQLEMMALYKKKGVNPLGGCLPILVQMPIFIGLYSTLSLALELRHSSFALWVNDLSAPEELLLGGFGVPVMVIIMVLTMLVQQWTTPSTMDKTQKKIMLIMPLVFGFIFVNFPAGLTLYMLVNNVVSITQQRSMMSQNPGNSLRNTVVASLLTFGAAYLLSLTA